MLCRELSGVGVADEVEGPGHAYQPSKDQLSLTN